MEADLCPVFQGLNAISILQFILMLSLLPTFCVAAPSNVHSIFHHEMSKHSTLHHAHHAKTKDHHHPLFPETYLNAHIFEALPGSLLNFTPKDCEMIENMAQSNTGTAIESDLRRVLAVVYIQSGNSLEIIDLFKNFMISAQRNAPEFAKKKLLVAALDDDVLSLGKKLGHTNIIRINGSTNMASTFKFQLVNTLLSFNISLLMMEADQVVLKHPFSGLVGDCDIELATDYVRPSLVFGDIYALDNPLGQPIREIADSANIGLILFSPNLQV